MSAALSFGFLGVFALVALVLVAIVVLVDRRDEPDPVGRRPYAAYVFIVVFLALFTVLFSLAAMVHSLVDLAVDTNNGSSQTSRTIQLSPQNGVVGSFGSETSSQSDESSTSSDDAHIRDAVRAGLLAAAAGAVLWFHVGLARAAVDDPEVTAGPARRVYNTYLYAAMTLAVIVVVGAATAFGYGVFRLIAPGVASASGVGDRKNAIPDLATTAVLGAGAAFIFLYHYRRRPTAPVAALPPPAPPPPPPAPRQPDRPARRAPAARKAVPRRPRRTE